MVVFEILNITKATIVDAAGTHKVTADNTADLTLRVVQFIGKAKLTGFADAPRLRDELIGAPKFKGIAGPMWNGDGWRYEAGRMRLHDE